MSEEVRHVFIRKHILYVATFIIIWTFYLASSYFQMYTSSLISTDTEDTANIQCKSITSKILN